jgi:hypothetical protein
MYYIYCWQAQALTAQEEYSDAETLLKENIGTYFPQNVVLTIQLSNIYGLRDEHEKVCFRVTYFDSLLTGKRRSVMHDQWCTVIDEIQ